MIERSGETPTVPRRGEKVATKLLRIAEKARREPKFQYQFVSFDERGTAAGVFRSTA